MSTSVFINGRHSNKAVKQPICDVSPTDVNECFAETHNCAMGERCVNTNGSFQCVRNDACEVGYHLGRDNQCQGRWAMEVEKLVLYLH